MIPTLVSFGPLSITTMALFLVLSWCVWSFFFWRELRSEGVDEERIFDCTFYATVAAFIAARIGFVAMNWDEFQGDILLMFATWVKPGFSWYAGLMAATVVLIVACRQYKIRAAMILDALVISIAWSITVVSIGALLSGSLVGSATDMVWGLNYIGDGVKRHPLPLYMIVVTLLVMMIVFVWAKYIAKSKLRRGQRGILFFLCMSIGLFVIEFFREGSVYFFSLSANQWLLLAIFAESIGALYVRGGGRERLTTFVRSIQGGIHGITHRNKRNQAKT